jgi:hypothetical protein
MTFQLYTDAVLTRDIAEHDLRAGDVVKIIDYHEVPGGEDGYSIEVFNALGETIAVTSIPESSIEPLQENEVFSIRRRQPAAA